MIRQNPDGDNPNINNTSYVDPTAIIIGKVIIGKNVYVGPGAIIIRADENMSSITINDNCNIQDRVTIHALANSSVLVKKNTSLAHCCIIHGPCEIGYGCFIGFGSVIFNAKIDKEAAVKNLCCVEDVAIPANRVVESSMVINNENDVKKLGPVNEELKIFVKNVVKKNLELVKGYRNV